MSTRIISGFIMKPPWTPCSTIVCRSSSSSTSKRHAKDSNHYDSLEIKSNATHNEIKSAYFKLSKQYHPDMNDSPEARLKFNDIASAYEVLGNHGKRKQYDRGLRISPTIYDGRNATMKETDFGDLHEEARRVQSEIFRNRTQPDGAPIYNFDTWTEAHYGKLLEKRQKELARAKYYMDLRAQEKRGHVPLQKELPAFAILILSALIILGLRLRFPDLDTPSSTWNNQEETKNNHVNKNQN